MPEDKTTLSLTGNTFTVLANNPGVTFTPNQLRLVAAGHIVWKHGCIKRLVWASSDQDLAYVELDPSGSVSPKNIDKYRGVFELAVSSGSEVGFCFNTQTHEMSMPHLFPCRCKCRRKG